MSVLPDELWLQILDAATAAGRLSARDLCCLSISCRRLNRLSQDAALWANLLSLDFPSDHQLPPSKSLYRNRYERDKAKRQAEWRRAMLRAESQVAVCKQKLKELETQIVQESERLKAASLELAHLERVRTASVAQNVWQPQIVRGSQKRIVEQCTVPVNSRLSTLKNEVRLCKQQIATYKKAYNEQGEKLSHCNDVLASLKYHPVVDAGDSKMSTSKKRKKLKTSNE